MTQPHRYQFEVRGTVLLGNLFAPARTQPRACAVLTGPLTSVKEQATGTYAAALAERGFLALRSIIARSAKAAVSHANLKTRSARSKTSRPPHQPSCPTRALQALR